MTTPDTRLSLTGLQNVTPPPKLTPQLAGWAALDGDATTLSLDDIRLEVDRHSEWRRHYGSSEAAVNALWQQARGYVAFHTMAVDSAAGLQLLHDRYDLVWNVVKNNGDLPLVAGALRALQHWVVQTHHIDALVDALQHGVRVLQEDGTPSATIEESAIQRLEALNDAASQARVIAKLTESPDTSSEIAARCRHSDCGSLLYFSRQQDLMRILGALGATPAIPVLLRKWRSRAGDQVKEPNPMDTAGSALAAIFAKEPTASIALIIARLSHIHTDAEARDWIATLGLMVDQYASDCTKDEAAVAYCHAGGDIITALDTAIHDWMNPALDLRPALIDAMGRLGTYHVLGHLQGYLNDPAMDRFGREICTAIQQVIGRAIFNNMDQTQLFQQALASVRVDLNKYFQQVRLDQAVFDDQTTTLDLPVRTVLERPVLASTGEDLRAAIALCVLMDDLAALPMLREVLAREERPEVRLIIVQQFSAWLPRHPSLVPVLEQIAGNMAEDPAVREVADSALGNPRRPRVGSTPNSAVGAPPPGGPPDAREAPQTHAVDATIQTKIPDAPSTVETTSDAVDAIASDVYSTTQGMAVVRTYRTDIDKDNASAILGEAFAALEKTLQENPAPFVRQIAQQRARERVRLVITIPPHPDVAISDDDEPKVLAPQPVPPKVDGTQAVTFQPSTPEKRRTTLEFSGAVDYEAARQNVIEPTLQALRVSYEGLVVRNGTIAPSSDGTKPAMEIALYVEPNTAPADDRRWKLGHNNRESLLAVVEEWKSAADNEKKNAGDISIGTWKAQLDTDPRQQRVQIDVAPLAGQALDVWIETWENLATAFAETPAVPPVYGTLRVNMTLPESRGGHDDIAPVRQRLQRAFARSRVQLDVHIHTVPREQLWMPSTARAYRGPLGLHVLPMDANLGHTLTHGALEDHLTDALKKMDEQSGPLFFMIEVPREAYFSYRPEHLSDFINGCVRLALEALTNAWGSKTKESNPALLEKLRRLSGVTFLIQRSPHPQWRAYAAQMPAVSAKAGAAPTPQQLQRFADAVRKEW